MYYRAHWYDPQIGRFLSEDPIGFGGGSNFYSYVDNSPVVLTDPYGLYPPSHPYCQSLLKRIAAIELQIRKRISEMRDDKMNLPGKTPDDKQKPSKSRRGHQMLINILKAKKAESRGIVRSQVQ